MQSYDTFFVVVLDHNFYPVASLHLVFKEEPNKIKDRLVAKDIKYLVAYIRFSTQIPREIRLTLFVVA